MTLFRQRRPWRLVASLLLFAASSIGLSAQGLGTIVGTVTDPSGAAIPGATVKITDEATSQSRDTTTNAQGYYVFPSLRPAAYSVNVTVAGFSPWTQRNVVLEADQSVTVNAAMSVQQSNQTVTVEASAVQVNTTTATVAEVVDTQRIVELPLNGRNAASLALITAGTVLAPASGVDQGSSKTFPVAVTLSANGSRQNQTGYRLDGSNNNDIYTNVNQPFPFPDALQEFSVQTSNYSARYGGNAGGVVNVITKSGTNDLHGDLFEFVRNAVFNARNFFAPTRDQLKRNQFGGTFGGPVVLPKIYNGKNKTFFFMGYQGTRIRNIGNTSSATFPTTAELNGDFSAFSTAIVNPLTGKPFPGNQIPTSMFDPAAVALTKYLPVTSGNGVVFYQSPLAQNFDEMLARVDHNITDNDHLSGRYFFDRFENVPFLDLHNYLAHQDFTIIDSHNLMLNETHVFSPSVLNDFRASFAREFSQRGPASGSIDVTQLGVKMFEPPGDHIIESLNVSGFFSIGQNDPASFIRDQYSLSDDISWVKGKHNMIFGVDATRAWVLLRNQFHQPGAFTFTPDVTNNAMASFLLGFQRTFLQGNGEYKDNRLNSFGLYFQDDWHVSRKLTLNLGLRYDPFFPWKETKGRIEIFSPAAYNAGQTSQVYVNAPPGLLFPGDPGVPQYGLRPNFKNFEPRVGFAYDVTGDGKTAIRGGFGMFYDTYQNGIVNNRFVDTSPFSVQVNLNPANTAQCPFCSPFSDPYKGITDPFPAPYPPPKNIVFPLPDLAASYDIGHGGVYQTPLAYDWNFAIERQLPGNWLARAAYVGSHASHLMETVELSPIVPATKQHLYPQYSDIAMEQQDINSSYNSLQLTAQKRFSRGFTLLANYTWSKSIDDLPNGQDITTVVSGGNSPIPWYLPGRHQFDTGPSEFDHTHRFVGSFVWQLPMLANSNAFLRYTVGGWQLSGLFTAQSGGPLTITAGKDQSGTALGTDRAQLLSTTVYGSGACGSVKPCVDWLIPSSFGLPPVGTFGNLGKGALRGPNLITYDGGLFKEFPFRSERMRFQFRAEFFNLFNRVNLNNPATSYSGSGFGRITGAGDPRIGQLALKFVF